MGSEDCLPLLEDYYYSHQAQFGILILPACHLEVEEGLWSTPETPLVSPPKGLRTLLTLVSH